MSNRRRPAHPLPDDVEIAEVVIDKTGEHATATVRTRKATPKRPAAKKVAKRDVREQLDPVGSLCTGVDELGVALVTWNQRTGAAGPLDAGLRGAATKAMVTIDHMVEQLKVIRTRLTAEVGRHDEATARRADRLLSRSAPLTDDGEYGVRRSGEVHDDRSDE
jgi:hypothetical protein